MKILIVVLAVVVPLLLFCLFMAIDASVEAGGGFSQASIDVPLSTGGFFAGIADNTARRPVVSAVFVLLWAAYSIFAARFVWARRGKRS